jgi:hypothetical protein
MNQLPQSHRDAEKTNAEFLLKMFSNSVTLWQK